MWLVVALVVLPGALGLRVWALPAPLVAWLVLGRALLALWVPVFRPCELVGLVEVFACSFFRDVRVCG